MAEVTKISRKIKTTLNQTTKYQILTYCFFNDISVSRADLNCLTLLALLGEHELTEFCKTATINNIFKSAQSARNAVTKAEKKGLIIKNGKSKKTIIISDKLQTQFKGVVLLDFKILGQ